jgi:hypothetical protein
MLLETVNLLSSLNLTAEQWQGVVKAIAIEAQGATVQRHPDVAKMERKREADRARVALHRANVALQSCDNAENEKFPLTPSKEKTSNLTVFGEIGRARDPSKPNPEEPEAFPDFWATYPKREGDRDRPAALKAFRKALNRASAQAIIAGAARYAAFCDRTLKTKTPFVRQARTWLNANGWQEEYADEQPPRNPSGKSIIEQFLSD